MAERKDEAKEHGSKDESEMFLLNTNFEDWTCEQTAEYFKTKVKDLGNDYSELFVNERIDGKVAHRLTDSDLKDMGIDNFGDRAKILQEIEKLQKISQQKDREKVIWEGEELLYFSWYEKLIKTCCGCCPQDASTYTLTGTHLAIKTVHPSRCGPISCCFGTKYDIDNVDISTIVDADVKGVPPSCLQAFCCGKTQEHIDVKTNSGETKILKLPKEEGATVSRKILNQMEIAQRVERS